jgi:hypothetical protein
MSRKAPDAGRDFGFSARHRQARELPGVLGVSTKVITDELGGEQRALEMLSASRVRRRVFGVGFRAVGGVPGDDCSSKVEVSRYAAVSDRARPAAAVFERDVVPVASIVGGETIAVAVKAGIHARFNRRAVQPAADRFRTRSVEIDRRARLMNACGARRQAVQGDTFGRSPPCLRAVGADRLAFDECRP